MRISNKFCFIFFMLLLIFTFTGCDDFSGSANLKYWWPGKLYHLYDSNPSVPETVYSDRYFPTVPGNFRMEYISDNGTYWYMDYEITINAGTSASNRGADKWFEIDLYDSGPVLHEWDSARKIDAIHEKKSLPSEETILSNEPTGKFRGEILGEDSLTTNQGTIRIRFGKLLD